MKNRTENRRKKRKKETFGYFLRPAWIIRWSNSDNGGGRYGPSMREESEYDGRFRKIVETRGMFKGTRFGMLRCIVALSVSWELNTRKRMRVKVFCVKSLRRTL